MNVETQNEQKKQVCYDNGSVTLIDIGLTRKALYPLPDTIPVTEVSKRALNGHSGWGVLFARSIDRADISMLTQARGRQACFIPSSGAQHS